MKNWIWAIIIVSILVGVGYVLRYCAEPELPTEVPPSDTTYVYGDTIWMPQDTVYILRWKKVPATTTIDTNGLVTKSIEKDTTFYSNQDTIKVKVKAEYIPEEDLFNLAMDIEHKDYTSFRVDTLKVTEYVAVEVPVNEPFYDEFIWGFGTAAVVFIAIILIFGG